MSILLLPIPFHSVYVIHLLLSSVPENVQRDVSALLHRVVVLKTRLLLFPTSTPPPDAPWPHFGGDLSAHQQLGQPICVA